ncbi:MAG TPA: PPOX class F420-dependent oxidoreductase [Euzebyales bacterium]|nr:PPOX class F420-dependent oxidoreductase [Euzebyales bacterium]
MTFTERERAYLSSQKLGRLATLDADGGLQNNPVGFHVNDDGTIDIRGHRLGRTRKFRNVRATAAVSLVVDDLASVNPWHPRGIEIRGHAEALTDLPAGNGHLSSEVIRIHPRRVIVWGGIDPDTPGLRGRDMGDRDVE